MPRSQVGVKNAKRVVLTLMHILPIVFPLSGPASNILQQRFRKMTRPFILRINNVGLPRNGKTSKLGLPFQTCSLSTMFTPHACREDVSKPSPSLSMGSSPMGSDLVTFGNPNLQSTRSSLGAKSGSPTSQIHGEHRSKVAKSTWTPPNFARSKESCPN